MSRNDAALYTGMTSASMSTVTYTKEAEKRTRRKELTNKKAQEIKPFAEEITELFEKERKSIGLEIANLIHVDSTEAEIKSAVIGLRLANDRIKKLQVSIEKVLRAK